MDFFIAGAPKCGTTALSYYLSSHPQIGFSQIKEPFYFNTDMPGYRRVITEAAYQQLFPSGSSEQLLEEGSVWYLYSKQAIPLIYVHNPNAKLIIMLRNPVEMVHAMYYQHRRIGTEHLSSFDKAWHACDARRAGQLIPRNYKDISTLYYDQIALFGEQLERVFDYFPADQVKVVWFEQFVASPLQCYKQVLDFLGLIYDQRDTFPKVNERQVYPSWLYRLLSLIPKRWFRYSAAVKRMLGVKQQGLFKTLQRAFGRQGQSQAAALLPKALQSEVRDRYKPDMKRLEQLLNCDLSSWYE